MEFNSHVATSVEQSKRLLELGLKKETADCGHFYGRQEHEEYEDWETIILDADWQSYWDVTDKEIPAWSLHRLIEILGPHRLPIHFRKKGRVDITTSHINQACSGRSGYNYYDSIIDCIAWLINEGYDYFNKDYLEEKK